MHRITFGVCILLQRVDLVRTHELQGRVRRCRCRFSEYVPIHEVEATEYNDSNKLKEIEF